MDELIVVLQAAPDAILASSSLLGKCLGLSIGTDNLSDADSDAAEEFTDDTLT